MYTYTTLHNDLICLAHSTAACESITQHLEQLLGRGPALFDFQNQGFGVLRALNKKACCKEAAFFVSVFFLRGYLWISRIYIYI